MKNIKKFINSFLWVLSLLVFLPASAAMGGGVNTAGNYALFVVGSLSTIGIHELGHAAAMSIIEVLDHESNRRIAWMI